MKELKIIDYKLFGHGATTDGPILHVDAQMNIISPEKILKDLLQQQAQLTREETIKECIEICKSEKCCCGQDVCDQVMRLEELLNQNNNETQI